jgi:uncharacterized protein (TIGR02118 family)
MMTIEEAITYFVRYRGLPQPQDAFVDYYREHHAKILAQMPGLRRLVLHLPTSWRDPFPVKADGTDFLAEMTFAGPGSFDEAVHSAARALARDDLAKLPRGGGTVTHQAMRSLRLL